jgi:hypothetical protein
MASDASVTEAQATAATLTVEQVRTLMRIFRTRVLLPEGQDMFEDLADLLDPARSRRSCPAMRNHQVSMTPVDQEEPDTYFLHRSSCRPECHTLRSICNFAFEVELQPPPEVMRILAKYYAVLVPQAPAQEEVPPGPTRRGRRRPRGPSQVGPVRRGRRRNGVGGVRDVSV